MNWFNRLEQKYGKYAIRDLMKYIIIVYAFGYILQIFYPQVYDYYFALDVSSILHGQIWRIFTFILQPPQTSIIFIFFVLYFYYMIGMVLERIWGSFKFNVYFFSGIILHIIAAFIIYFVFGYNYHMNTYYINLALFLAFAFEQPDMEVLLFFILPIKMKWLGYLDGALFAITIIGGYLTPFMPINMWYGLAMAGLLSTSVMSCYVQATAALVSMLNFIIFVVLFKKNSFKNATQKNFNKAMKNKTSAKSHKGYRSIDGGASHSGSGYSSNSGYDNNEQDLKRTEFRKINVTGTQVKHKCAICGRTELDDENLVFRYCSKCNPSREYCNEHLYTHIHVNENI